MSKRLLNNNKYLLTTFTTYKNPLFSAVLVFAITFAIYLFTLAPTVTGEDSGELIAAAYGGGVAHPPGYPLWTMLASLSIKIFPFGSVAYRVNLLSTILSSLSASIFCLTLQRFFSIKTVTSVIGSICFACGLHLWSQAVIAEVYTLHVFLVCTVIYFLLSWKQTDRNLCLYTVAFATGLALSNHHLAILLGPVLLVFVLINKPGILLSPKIIVLCLVFLALGLLPYLYLPIAAGNKPFINWGNPDTWEAFVRHVLRKQYGDDSMHTARSIHRLFGHWGVLWNWCCQQYTIVAIPFTLAGIICLCRKYRNLLYFTIGFFLMHTVILAEILNFNFQRQELFCTRVFILPAYIITAIWLTIGCEQIGQTPF